MFAAMFAFLAFATVGPPSCSSSDDLKSLSG